jgi:hypothetical protein
MFRSKTICFVFLLFASAAATVAGAREVDSILAAVNGSPITLNEILPTTREQEFRLGNAYSGKTLEKEVLKLRYKAVEEIIDRKLIIADFHNQNLHIPPQEVENELDRWGKHIGCHSRKDLEERIRKSGSTLSGIRERILQRMIVQVMRRRAFMLAELPTPSEVFHRFKEEEKNLSFPGSVELALVKLPLNDGENAQKIAATLKKTPEAWDKIALQYPLTPGTNGKIGSVELPQLRSEFAKTMRVISPGRIYSNIKTADGIYFIKVLKYLPPRKAVFSKHAEAIRKKTEEEIYRKSSAAYAARLRAQAGIEYFFPVPEGVEKK